MRIVIALGGNAILQRKQPLEESIQRKNIAEAAKLIAKAAHEHNVIVTHGNGPQVGLLALQNEAYKKVSPYPLDVLGAETEGMIGYLLAQELKNAAPTKEIAALLTQTLVDARDPAFSAPTKFVGPVYNEQDAKQLQQEKNWCMKADGDFYRRVVASPKPVRIIEEQIIKHLLTMPNLLLICAGGGGVPVIQNEDTTLDGIEAVVDKDHASNVLAQSIHADAFIMLTDVSAVETNFGAENSKQIQAISPKALADFQFAQGSMGPKVEAAISFVENGGAFSAIGSLKELPQILQQEKGTYISNAVKQMSTYD